MLITELRPSRTVEALRLEEDRQAYLLCVEGSVQITDGKGQVHELNQHDGCELKGAMDLAPTAGAPGK